MIGRTAGFMRNSDAPGLIQRDDIHEAYALYLKRYLDEYKNAGVNIVRMTLQNEPHVEGQFLFTYPCNGMNSTQQAGFLKNWIGPLLRKHHPEIEIYIHDDQKNDMIDAVKAILNDPGAAPFVTGVAFHWWGVCYNG